MFGKFFDFLFFGLAAGDWPTPITVMLLGALPIAESRVAVPMAISVFNLTSLEAIFYATAGAALPLVLLLSLLGPISGYLINHSGLARKFFDWLFSRTRHKFIGRYEKYGLLALTLFVAIPLPISGFWTGAAAAFVFGIPKKKAFIFIIFGVIISGSAMALATTGVLEFLNWLN